MALINYTVTRQARERIGDSVARVLKQIPQPFTIVATVPRILTFFANCPERYEVTEVDLIVDDRRAS